MTRRSLAAILLAAALLPISTGAQAADPPPKPEFPRATCTKKPFTDPTGDGYINPTGVPAANVSKAPGLDVIGGYLRVTPDAVITFVELDDIPATMPSTDPSYRYLASFKYGVTWTTGMMIANPTYGVTGTYPYVNPALTGATGGIDLTADLAWVSIPRAIFDTKAGIPAEDGAKVEAVKFWSEWQPNAARTFSSDTLEPTGDAAKWTMGEEYCFGPPPATLSDLVVKNVQYGDPTTMSAKLVSDAGTALAGKPVEFAITGDPAGAKTATTDANGIAKVTFPSGLKASGTPYPVTVTFAGDATDGKAKLTGAITITPEKTVFAPLAVAKPTATTRTVTATLTDDDKKPLAAQKVEWLVNGKKVATTTTDAKGKSVYKGAKPGQLVQARFVAVSGKYLAALSNKPKV